MKPVPQADAARPVTAPDFLLSRATGSLRSRGVRTTFAHPIDAVEALRDGRTELVVGALGFHPEKLCALSEPAEVVRSDGPLEPPAYFRNRHSAASIVDHIPGPDEHIQRVVRAISAIRDGELDKVVLARAVRLHSDQPFDPHAVCARLIDSNPHRDGFYVDLSPAGGIYRDAVLVGSSPELLIRRRGPNVLCHPLAGSAPRQTDPASDQQVARALRESAKDTAEHRYVVDALAESLRPLCTDLEIPQRPTLAATGEMWHLGTPIRARLRNLRTTALELALAVHPTPAVCGTPTDIARKFIDEHEENRGFYSGSIGWSDSSGDGEWMVTIRCARIDADRTQALAWAGGGVVAASDPVVELDETSAKLTTMLRSLGVTDQREATNN